MASQDRNTSYGAECVLPAQVERAQEPPIPSPSSTPISSSNNSTSVRLKRLSLFDFVWVMQLPTF
ncbi:hypothetical protein L211DRAFT_456303 [Terfezia boudieri ATCC MYA-4762]|uniref:Uncharacterized protein n=1 Tax=Terfezia boudieri ATCC MYA-4762 TaxID=1051890 RepID=A0A3N4LHR9_9PEZI|nr:hypothetical protein L211DRAFT_456303 [Terfezia boudieri ATCC MYA-4762]